MLSRERKEYLIQVLLDEFRTYRDETLRRLEAQDRLLSYIIALMTGAIAALLPLRTALGPFLWVAIMSIAALISLLALMSALNDLWVAVQGSYIEQVLRPRLEEICGVELLLWESFARREKNHPFRAFLGAFRPIVYMAPALSVLALFFFVKRITATTFEWILFGANAVLFVTLLLAVFHIGLSYFGIVKRPFISRQDVD